MYKCSKCGEEFFEPERRSETIFHSELDSGNRYETGGYDVCPHCGSEEIDDYYTCLACGNGAATEKECLCKWCDEDISNEFNAFEMRLREDYKLTEGEFLEIIGAFLADR